MRACGKSRHSLVGYILLAFSFHSMSGCSRPDWYVGVGGKYNEAKLELVRRTGGNVDKAIVNLESIVQQDPTYRDSLTLLGRGYYKKGRYFDAHMILQRALAVNKDDEIAWVVFGLTQLRLGDNQKGLESLKGGLTLLSRAMKDGYRGFEAWDLSGRVRSSLQRSALLVIKGLDDRENLISTTDVLLARIDEEEWLQSRERSIERVTEVGQ